MKFKGLIGMGLLAVLLLVLAGPALFTSSTEAHDEEDVEIWVSNQGTGPAFTDGKVQILDEDLNVLETILTGKKTHMGDFTDDGKCFYTTNVGEAAGGNNVVKIDAKDRTIVQTFATAGAAHAVVVRTGDDEVWINNLNDNFEVAERDKCSKAKDKIVDQVDIGDGPGGAVDKPVCMGFAEDGDIMYTSATVGKFYGDGTDNGDFLLVDPNKKIDRGPIKNGTDVGGRPCGMSLNQKGNRMLVTVGSFGGGGNLVGYIDVDDNAKKASKHKFVDKTTDLEASLPTGTALDDPHAIVEVKDGKNEGKILLGNRKDNEVWVLDKDFEFVRKTGDLGGNVDLIDIGPEGKYAYACVRGVGVAKINIKDGTHTTKVLGGDPHGCLVRPNGDD